MRKSGMLQHGGVKHGELQQASLQKPAIPSRDTFLVMLLSCCLDAVSGKSFDVRTAETSLLRMSRLFSTVPFRHSLTKTNYCSRNC
jgi:hypothetical protein